MVRFSIVCGMEVFSPFLSSVLAVTLMYRFNLISDTFLLVKVSTGKALLIRLFFFLPT